MRLVVDASVLVAELLRESGRLRLADRRLDLFIAEHALNEVHHELPKRAKKFGERHDRSHTEMLQLIDEAFETIRVNVTALDEAVYAPAEEEARWRSERDPNDWPTVAAALCIESGIWTNDGDFLGTGLATWSTATIRMWLERQAQA